MDISRKNRSMRRGCVCTLLSASLFAIIGLMPTILAAAPLPPGFAELADEYLQQTHPLMEQFCLDCHSGEKPEGDLDLEQFATLTNVRHGTKSWQKVAEMLDNGEMPPEDAEQPSTQQLGQLRGWVERYLDAEALANAGDPGPVVLRRLNNAEYTYTIRELTELDLEPAHMFPADSAAGEGFTNTGNALVMSPALLTKYLDAGKEIARHAVLLPDGFRFSTHVTRRDWTDEILAQIRGFYGEYVNTSDLGVGSSVGNINAHGDTRIGLAGQISLEPYLAATIAERNALSKGEVSIEAVARQRGLNAKYLGILWTALSGADASIVLDALRLRWQEAKPEEAAELAAYIAAWQKGLWTFGPVGLIGRKGGPSRWMELVNPLVAQQDFHFTIPADSESTENEPVVFSLVATDAGDGNDHDFIIWKKPRFVLEGEPDILLRDVAGATSRLQRRDAETAKSSDFLLFGKHPDGQTIDPDSLCVRAPSVIEIRLPAGLVAGRDFVTTAVLEEETGGEGSVQVDMVVGTQGYESGLRPSEVIVTFSEVLHVFSDHRVITYKRPLLVGDSSRARGRFESAFDEFRRVFPIALCYTQIVPVDEVLTLALYYREDDHLARLMLDDQQAARLDRLWEELHYVSLSPLLGAEALDLLLEVMTGNPQHDEIDQMHGPMTELANAFRQELVDSEPKHIDALVDFASRAYRRPLSDAEADELRGLYRRMRPSETTSEERTGREYYLSHEDAFRLTLARIFVSTQFLYRLENAPAGNIAVPVSNWELANRLSYFLWSSMPDKQLRATAEAGRLTDIRLPDGAEADDRNNPASGSELLRQTHRMLKDARMRRLATEFACQWLHIYDFDSLDEKSETLFPEFADLRHDMYEESILFFTDLFTRDASLLSMFNADHTFVNERMAKFYGIDGIEGEAWRRVEGMRGHGRGGILGQSAPLAKQSGASRTNPILRGNWISEVLLGEKLPRPPADVPQLSTSVPEGLTERQLIERHSSEAACAKCHARIDPFGFALENFDAIGRRRERSSTGLSIDSQTILPDGTRIEGLDGLRDYLVETRRQDVLRQFCRKLLGYAIGRELQLSDEPLLDEMMDRLAKQDYRFFVAVETIVLSDQFRMKRATGND